MKLLELAFENPITNKILCDPEKHSSRKTGQNKTSTILGQGGLLHPCVSSADWRTSSQRLAFISSRSEVPRQLPMEALLKILQQARQAWLLGP